MPLVPALRSRPRLYLAAGVVVVVLVAATLWLLGSFAAAPAPQLVAARTGTLSATVPLTGTISPEQRADLSFSTGGQVIAVQVTVGQQVAQGQALAAIDAASLPGQTAQARSGLASAQARLAADRTAGASAAQIDADNAAITSAQAQVDVAVQNESQATLTAPFAGTVAAVNVTPGQRVSAGGGGTSSSNGAANAGSGAAGPASGSSGGSEGTGSSGGGSVSAAVVVVSTGSYRIDATVDDTQVGLLAAGQAAAITPNGATTPIPGTVSSVGLVATSTSGVASYPVTITVTGSPPGLHLGASAQVEVTTQQIRDAVLVPTAAVHGAGVNAAVTVMEQGRQVNRPVTVGIASGGRTQIVTGLHAGEQVVLPATAAGARPAGGTGGFGGFGGGGNGGSGRTGTPGGGAGSRAGTPTAGPAGTGP